VRAGRGISGGGACTGRPGFGRGAGRGGPTAAADDGRAAVPVAIAAIAPVALDRGAARFGSAQRIPRRLPPSRISPLYSQHFTPITP
jgi:hypothetical protein